MYTDSRENEVRLLKRLWAGLPTICPKCRQAELVHLHKKAKRVIWTGSARPAEKFTAP